MLTKIDVVYGNELGEQAMALPILNATTKDSLIIRKVTGLNPPATNLFMGDYARDGGTYQGRRVGNRNVVMTIDLNPDPALGESVSGLRDLVYKIFQDPLIDADYVELVLHDDEGRIRNVHGYTEAIETDIFDIETAVQVSMLCPDPYIRDLVETVLVNEAGTWVTVPFTYRGTAETGFSVEIHVANATNILTLKNNNKTMVFHHDFEANDVINLNTNRGERDVTYTRDGVTLSLLGKLDVDSPWLELHSQSNTMTVYGDVPSNQVAGVKTLTYRASYWGV